MKAGMDFHLAFSPEREDPGNPGSSFELVPKVVGGLTPACLEKAMAIYGRAITKLSRLLLPRRGGNQAAREYLSQRQHCHGQRAETRLCGDGH